MGIGVSLILIAVGAVLTWAVNATSSSFDVNTVGVILMIVGAVGLLLSLMFIVLLTVLVFPAEWVSLLQGSAMSTGILVARDALLTAAAAVSCWRVLSAARSGGEDAGRLTDNAVADTAQGRV